MVDYGASSLLILLHDKKMGKKSKVSVLGSVTKKAQTFGNGTGTTYDISSYTYDVAGAPRSPPVVVNHVVKIWIDARVGPVASSDVHRTIGSGERNFFKGYHNSTSTGASTRYVYRGEAGRLRCLGLLCGNPTKGLEQQEQRRISTMVYVVVVVVVNLMWFLRQLSYNAQLLRTLYRMNIPGVLL